VAKRGFDERNSKRVDKVKSEVVKAEGVLLQLLVHTKLKIPGPITGKPYLFDGSGSIVMVDAEDAPGLLERTRPGSCCGGVPGPHPVFKLVN